MSGRLKKLVVYEIHQTVQTALGENEIKLMETTCLDNDEAGMSVFEERLAPRIREYEKWGEIIVIRQTREEVAL